MANKFTVSTTFKAHDRMTKAVKGMNRVVSRLGAITKRVAKVGLAAFGIALGLTVREFVNFDQAITSSSAKFGDLNLATAKGQRQLKELGRIARDVGAATQFTATEAAQGLDFLAMAGFNVQQAMVGLPQVVDLATVGNIDLARATDISSDALGAFNMMVKDSTQLQINMTRINDVMAKTITSSNTNLETLFETIQKGAPSFTAAGQSIESFNALAGAMANAGVKGSVAGIALKNVMLKLANPAGSAAKILKTLGVRTQDSSGNFLDIIDILGDFEKGLKGMGNAQRLAALKAVFGERTITGINVLLATGSDALREYRKSIKEATGAAKKMADIIRGTLMNRLKALKSAAIELGFKFIEGFGGKAGGAIKDFTEKLRKFDVEPIVKGIGKAFKELKPWLKAAYDIFVKLWPVIKKWGPAVLGIAVAVKVWSIAQGLLNLAMNANPYILMAAAIAVFVLALKDLIDVWPDYQKYIEKHGLWKTMEAEWGAFIRNVPGFGNVFKLPAVKGLEYMSGSGLMSKGRSSGKTQSEVDRFFAEELRSSLTIDVDFHDLPPGVSASVKQKARTGHAPPTTLNVGSTETSHSRVGF